ncbi:MAG: hypothetical protein MHMPM18_000379 [Marteilia pararefringens]
MIGDGSTELGDFSELNKFAAKIHLKDLYDSQKKEINIENLSSCSYLLNLMNLKIKSFDQTTPNLIEDISLSQEIIKKFFVPCHTLSDEKELKKLSYLRKHISKLFKNIFNSLNCLIDLIGREKHFFAQKSNSNFLHNFFDNFLKFITEFSQIDTASEIETLKLFINLLIKFDETKIIEDCKKSLKFLKKRFNETLSSLKGEESENMIKGLRTAIIYYHLTLILLQQSELIIPQIFGDILDFFHSIKNFESNLTNEIQKSFFQQIQIKPFLRILMKNVEFSNHLLESEHLSLFHWEILTLILIEISCQNIAHQLQFWFHNSKIFHLLFKFLEEKENVEILTSNQILIPSTNSPISILLLLQESLILCIMTQNEIIIESFAKFLSEYQIRNLHTKIVLHRIKLFIMRASKVEQIPNSNKEETSNTKIKEGIDQRFANSFGILKSQILSNIQNDATFIHCCLLASYIHKYSISISQQKHIAFLILFHSENQTNNQIASKLPFYLLSLAIVEELRKNKSDICQELCNRISGELKNEKNLKTLKSAKKILYIISSFNRHKNQLIDTNICDQKFESFLSPIPKNQAVSQNNDILDDLIVLQQRLASANPKQHDRKRLIEIFSDCISMLDN